MNAKRITFIMAGFIILMVAALIGGAYGINSLLSKQSATLVGLKAKSQSLDQEQLSLNNTKKEIEKYSGLEKIAEAVVPQDKNQAEAVREIINLASANNVPIGSITFPASTLGAAGVPGRAAASSSAVSAAPTKVDLNSPANALSQLLPVKSIPGVYELTITITSGQSDVTYENFLSFLQALEKNRRTAEITSISLNPSQKNPDLLTFTLGLEEYIKP